MGFKIIGAGSAGLLAGALLRDEAEAIYEKQPSLPNNHRALLRFRSAVVGDAVGIPFQKVPVIKEVKRYNSAIASALLYSRKVTGKLGFRSMMTGEEDIVERYIAPGDFIQQLSKKIMAPIHYNFDFWTLAYSGEGPIISTMPMPDLMDNLRYEGPRPKFRSIVGVTVTARLINCNAFATMYVPDPYRDFYRVSITGNKLIIEYAFPDRTMDVDKAKELKGTIDTDQAVLEALTALGVLCARTSVAAVDHECHVSRYQKIEEVDEGLRRRFMMWATDKHNVYSLGRFATWRPSVMMDDLVQDVAKIRAMAMHGNYQHRIL